MAKHVGKKFTWVIKNFSSLQSGKRIYSVPVLIGDCKWRLCAYPKGNDVAYFSLFLQIADYKSLPSGWSRNVKYRLTILTQLRKKCRVEREGYYWFGKVSWNRGYPFMIPLTELHDKDAGFLVNDELIIVAEIDVLEVIGTLDVSVISEESSRPLKKIKLNDDYAESSESLKEALSVKESMVVNGFQVLPSQVESVSRIFERHPDIVVDFRANNQNLRTTCMNFLLSLIETLCKSPLELSNEDLVDANIALTCLKDVSFKVDWLEKKLDQVKEKKKKELSVVAQLQETEENILKLKQKFSELEAELSATRTALSFDDVV
ncbi:MATH/TRAF domain [Arabidopsis thaliana x Arabidopsis arenosa]|uniref:MATH/TRAF domain n=1 Tax=Arabidopsis thaliana x Arabidopsis arenosa TaxID=1240361 RepID=A0A8T2BF10_9BRAS|nr:MATH/TRAF domain [Arabidopsis thaliana x Arabidopsis arenosa]